MSDDTATSRRMSSQQQSILEAMRWVVSNHKRTDRTYQQKTMRAWFEADDRHFLEKLMKLEEQDQLTRRNAPQRADTAEKDDPKAKAVEDLAMKLLKEINANRAEYVAWKLAQGNPQGLGGQPSLPDTGQQPGPAGPGLPETPLGDVQK